MRPHREMDPAESVLSYFACELRRLRAASGLSQKQLADRIKFTTSAVGMAETAARMPSKIFAERCDEALGADGALKRLWPLVNRQAFPKGFGAFVDLEQAATAIRSYEPHVVDGLVQTEEYARELLSQWHQADVNAAVAARMERQSILEHDAPPFFSLVLDEAALRRPVGGPNVMRRQLSHLYDVSRRAKTLIQILPFDAPVHSHLGGHLTLLTFLDGPPVAYLENYEQRQLIGTAEEVTRCASRYDRASADALSPEASRDLIASMLEDPNPWATRYRN